MVVRIVPIILGVCWLEVPTSRPVGLGCSQGEDCLRLHLVHVPGGGPALGALYAAVSPSLTTVGFHPSCVNASAIRLSRAESRILLAGPSTTRSKSCVAIVMTLFGLRAMFLALRVFGPAVK